ncbi:MAG: hypothetical protein CFE44_03225 [Burkholderiales bacterium PBB4]|nr:MAG: hypothetical protein CFE44_03225 [Burkholderiales bacterium PBB4]
MDDIVRQAMAKWPHVPHCYGWLGLDARGHWYMRDDGAQARGSFDSGQPGSKGAQLQHEKLLAFIQRNYAADTQGQWYFQNGPQRVYVELESTPWIWRIDADFSVKSHTGETVECLRCMSDEVGRVYLHTRLGLGLVHSWDVTHVAQALDVGYWELETAEYAQLEQQFGFIRSPLFAQSMLLKM